MVPFSFPQPLLKSRVMKMQLLVSSPLTRAKNPHEPNGKDGVSPSPIGEHYTPLCGVHPSFKNWVHGIDHRPSRWLKTQKRLNEPNSQNANRPLNIDDFTNFDFFKK
jgi:hypothetical protein